MKKGKYYKKIFGYFKNKKILIILFLITSFFNIISSTVSPMFSAKVLENITSVNIKGILVFSALVLVIDIIYDLINYINALAGENIRNDIEIKIKEDVTKELFNLEIQNFDKKGTGFFSERINREPANLASVFDTIRYSLTSVLSSLGIVIYIFLVNIYIGLFIIVSSFIFFYFSILRTKRWEKRRKKSNEMDEEYTSSFSEIIRGIKDIKVLNLKNVIINKTVKDQKNISKFNFESSKEDQFYWRIESATRSIIEFCFIVLCIILIKHDLLTGANMLIVYMYRGRASHLIDNISSMYRDIKDFNLSIERLYELIDGSVYHKEVFGNINLNNLKGKIEFKNTKFKYDNKNVLKGISFTINPNETIGIVGASGVGKTTIFNLINKLYNVNDGSIFIDNIDINELTENTIRSNISTITQSPYIFNMTIKDNIKLVNPTISDEELISKSKLCLLNDYVKSLENGYDTLVGENGVILSGGLKQRLAILRALVKNSKIILLDEATSSLDNETQEYIQESIKKIRKDYTILIIAHRLSTIIDCDKILVLDKGKVVGFDTHENLINSNPIYQKLYHKEIAK